MQTLKYRSESKKVDDGEDVEAAAMASPSVIIEEPGRAESAFFQRSNIPIITTDMVLDNDDHDADDEDDEVIATSYLKMLPDRTKIASLSVPSFRFYSSDGDSSTCTTPGQVTPVRSRSPLFGQTGKKFKEKLSDVKKSVSVSFIQIKSTILDILHSVHNHLQTINPMFQRHENL